jgi:hypothetical protein
MLHRSSHCWKHRRKASSGVFRSLATALHLMRSKVAKCVPLRPVCRVGNSPKSLGARSGECGGWVMTTSDVWLCALSWCRNHCPCLPLVAPLPLQNSHVEVTSNSLSRRYELTTHQTVCVKEFRELFDYPSYSLNAFFLIRPNLFASCNNTFSKWREWLRMACRRVLSSTPL